MICADERHNQILTMNSVETRAKYCPIEPVTYSVHIACCSRSRSWSTIGSSKCVSDPGPVSDRSELQPGMHADRWSFGKSGLYCNTIHELSS